MQRRNKEEIRQRDQDWPDRGGRPNDRGYNNSNHGDSNQKKLHVRSHRGKSEIEDQDQFFEEIEFDSSRKYRKIEEYPRKSQDLRLKLETPILKESNSKTCKHFLVIAELDLVLNRKFIGFSGEDKSKGK
jgi:hypothetical protein